MGKCKFNSKWLENDQLSDRLKPVLGNDLEARYIAFVRNALNSALSVKAMESHIQAEKHEQYVQAKSSWLQFANPARTVTTETVRVQVTTPSLQSLDIRSVSEGYLDITGQ